MILFRFEEEEKKKRWPTHGKRITPNANMDDKLFFLFFLLLGSPIFSKGFSLKLSREKLERERQTATEKKSGIEKKIAGEKERRRRKKKYMFIRRFVSYSIYFSTKS